MHGLSLHIADGSAWDWARNMFCREHYLQREPDARSRPFVYVVRLSLDSGFHSLVGCLAFGRPQATSCYAGDFTFGSLAERQQGKVRFERWEVLNLSRVWLCPDVQTGGIHCHPAIVPGFVDRKGVFRSTVASTVVRLTLERIGAEYLLANPPVFLEQPYAIRAVLSYCDTRYHRGTLYQASGFRLARTNRYGMQTWFTEDVPSLTAEQDTAIRRASVRSSRCAEKRRNRAPASAAPSLFVHS